MIPVRADTFGYPPNVKILADGVLLRGGYRKYKFQRRIPVDGSGESRQHVA
jgi:hypothetical protein